MQDSGYRLFRERHIGSKRLLLRFNKPFAALLAPVTLYLVPAFAASILQLWHVITFQVLFEGMRKPRIPADVKAYSVEMGRQGGLKGGEAHSKTPSPERKDIAQKAIAARWAKCDEHTE